MVKAIGCFIFVCCICLGAVFASEPDSIPKKQNLTDRIFGVLTYKHKKFSISTYPIVDYDVWNGLSIGIMPIVQIYPKEDFQKYKYYRPTSIVPSIVYSNKGRLAIEVDVIGFAFNSWSYNLQFKFIEFPDAFFGIGGEDSASFSDFHSKHNFLLGEITKGISNRVFLGVGYDFSYVRNLRIQSDGLNESIQGYNGGWSCGIGPVFIYDSRNNVIQPERGWYMKASLLIHSNILGSTYDFSNIKFDLRKYLSLSNSTILGLQLVNAYSFGETPFYKMPSLGGKMALRGISHPNKYIDHNMWYTRMEFRQHLFSRFGAVVFTGVGSVFDQNIAVFKDLQYVGGLGVRFQLTPKDRLNFRADYGISSSGDRAFFMTVSEAF